MSDNADFCFAYLDDCVFAGDHDIVGRAIALLRDAAKEIGLELNWDKCKLICTTAHIPDAAPQLFPAECPALTARGFKLLGAPIGPESFCNALSSKRVAKNGALLQAIADLEDPQIALLLLRNCASFGKISFSLRTTPTRLHAKALQDFDDSIRACFEALSALHPNADQWIQASLAMHIGGLGLRSAVAHAPAAQISSLSACSGYCATLDTNFQWEASLEDSTFSAAIRHFNACLPEADQVAAIEGTACVKRRSV